MPISNIAVVYDDAQRADTTGVHCLRALKALATAKHLRPTELSRVRPREFDLYLRIDDGIPFDWPEKLRPCAYWAIDTHIDLAARVREGAHFDWVFAAQQNGSRQLLEAGLSHAAWLPLACDPAIHRPHHTPKSWDVGFVGQVIQGRRANLISLLMQWYPRSFFGHAYGDELARVYSASRIAFNCAVVDDVNMRVFEAMACGAPLVTNDLSGNGQSELFRDGEHLITYADADELLDKVSFYLRHNEARNKLARNGRDSVTTHHTYRHRMRSILESVRPRPLVRSAAPPAHDRDSDEITEKVDVVIKSFLRPEALHRLLRSIRHYYPLINVTIVDDGTLDSALDDASVKCRELISRDRRLRVMSQSYGSGVSAGRNLLVDITSRPFLLFLDDDFIFSEDTRIDVLLSRLGNDPSLGVVAGSCVDCRGITREVRKSCGVLREVAGTLHHDTAAWRDGESGRCDYFPTFALIRRSLFDSGIRWRGGIGGEHYDFCLQVQRSSWHAAIVPFVTVDHDQYVPTLPGYLQRRLDYHSAQQWLLKTWGLNRVVQDGNVICENDMAKNNDSSSRSSVNSQSTNPDRVEHFRDQTYFYFARPDVLELVPHTARRVLDIGCGAGLLGAAIKARQPAEVVGIEMNEDAAAAARKRLNKVLSIDVELAAWPFPRQSFDCVILADVLEHLRKPEMLLARVRESLTLDGVVVASIPNARHHSIVAALIGGHWTYEAAGLLDRTHLRFFTRREIEKLFYREGFELREWRLKDNSADHGPTTSEAAGQIRIGPLAITGLPPQEAEEFSAYQFLIVARPMHTRVPSLTSIVILTHNQLGYTRLCLDSIRMRTDEPYELIVVDNASTDGTLEYLQSLHGITLIGNPENRGFPAGVNQGLSVATGDQVLLLNNDTIVTTGWLRRMLDCLQSAPDIGIVGPVSNSVSGIQRVDVSYDALEALDGFAWDWGKAHHSQLRDVDRLIGFCMLIRREVISRIGSFDESFGVGTFEDDDYCLRAATAGFRCTVALDAFVHHFGSRTFLGNRIDMAHVLDKNKRIFSEKWSGSAVLPLSEDSNVASSDRRHDALRFRTEYDSSGAMRLKRDQPKISLCMIVRDNERTLGACLASIKPWVDEIVVVDTGSNDATMGIARQYGAQVFELPWPDSFALARNESLRHATGEWIFWMDSDDTISAKNGQKLRDLAKNSVPPDLLGFVMQVHCPNGDEAGYADVTVVDHVKMFRNLPDLRFEGRIHEQIMPALRRAGGETKWTDIFVTHSGSDNSPEGHRQKQQRDLRLLKMEIQEQPDHPFVLFNLGMTYGDMGEHAQAITELQACIRLSDLRESHLRKAYALLIASHIQLDQFDDAANVCRAGRLIFPNDPELWFREGLLAHHFGHLAKAAHAYLQALQPNESPHFSSIDRGIYGYKTRHNLALVYEEQGLLKLAEDQWRLALIDAPTYRPTWRGLANNLILQNSIDKLVVELERMRQDRRLCSEAHRIAAQLAQRRGDQDAARRELESGLREFPRDISLWEDICRQSFELDDPSCAIKKLRQLIALDPTSGPAWHNLGSCYLRMSLPNDAEEAFQKAIHLRPHFAASHLYLGFCLEQRGDLRGAKREWQLAATLDRHDSRPHEALARIGEPASVRPARS